MGLCRISSATSSKLSASPTAFGVPRLRFYPFRHDGAEMTRDTFDPLTVLMQWVGNASLSISCQANFALLTTDNPANHFSICELDAVRAADNQNGMTEENDTQHSSGNSTATH